MIFNLFLLTMVFLLNSTKVRRMYWSSVVRTISPTFVLVQRMYQFSPTYVPVQSNVCISSVQRMYQFSPTYVPVQSNVCTSSVQRKYQFSPTYVPIQSNVCTSAVQRFYCPTFELSDVCTVRQLGVRQLGVRRFY